MTEQHQALGHQLTDDASPAGAQRRPHGQLACTRGAAREKKVGHVTAADQQHDADNTDEEQGRAVQIGADDRVVHGLERDATVAIGIGKLTCEAFGHGAEVRARCIDGDTGFQAANRHEAPATTQLGVLRKP